MAPSSTHCPFTPENQTLTGYRHFLLWIAFQETPPDTLKGLDQLSFSLEREDVVLSEVSPLDRHLHGLWKQSTLTQTLSLEEALHPFEPGNWVWIWSFRWKSLLQRKWNGPFQVLLTTQTSVKVGGKEFWMVQPKTGSNQSQHQTEPDNKGPAHQTQTQRPMSGN